MGTWIETPSSLDYDPVLLREEADVTCVVAGIFSFFARPTA